MSRSNKCADIFEQLLDSFRVGRLFLERPQNRIEWKWNVFGVVGAKQFLSSYPPLCVENTLLGMLDIGRKEKKRKEKKEEDVQVR